MLRQRVLDNLKKYRAHKHLGPGDHPSGSPQSVHGGHHQADIFRLTTPPEGYGKGRRVIEAPRSGDHKALRLKMRPNILRALVDGTLKPQLTGLETSETVFQHYTPVGEARKTYAQGSLPDLINAAIGAQSGRAWAYLQRAVNLPRGGRQIEVVRLSLLYKAGRILERVERDYVPVLQTAATRYQDQQRASIQPVGGVL